MGADPFALSVQRLMERIELIKKYIPNTQTVTMYARTDNVAAKSDDELKELKEAGVDDLYIGVDDDIKTGTFIPATEKENLEEEFEFLASLELSDCYFWAVHPLDFAKIEGMLGKDKQKMLETLRWSIDHVTENSISRTSREGTL